MMKKPIENQQLSIGNEQTQYGSVGCQNSLSKIQGEFFFFNNLLWKKTIITKKISEGKFPF